MKETPHKYLKLDSVMKFRIKKELVPDYDSFVGYMAYRIFRDFDITDIDGDTSFGRHIFVEVTEGVYSIRTWNIKETEKSIVVDFSIYQDEDWSEEN
jgi:hypothetical protein